MLSHHEALISAMVLVSAADEDMSDSELARMSGLVANLPVFADFDLENLPRAASKTADMLASEDGVELLLAEIATALPPILRETAYVLACDIAAADGRVVEEEMEVLEVLRHQLGLERLIAAGLERGVRARHAKL